MVTAPASRTPAARWLSVWPTDTAATDPAVAETPWAMPAAVAAHAIAAYTQPGAMVLDPGCVSGTVLTAAIDAGRHAIGITPDPRRWRQVRAEVNTAKRRGAPGDALLLDRHPDRRSWIGLPPADLVLTAPRPATLPGPGPAPDPSGSPAWSRGLLAAYRDLPRPGGRLVVVIPPTVAPDGDLAAELITAGQAMGLIPLERCAALLPSGDHHPAYSPAAGRSHLGARHLDVLVFRPAKATLAEQQTAVAPLPAPPPRRSPSDATRLRVA